MVQWLELFCNNKTKLNRLYEKMEILSYRYTINKFIIFKKKSGISLVSRISSIG